MMICPKCRSSEVEVHLEGWLYDHVNRKGKNCPGSGADAIESKDLKTRVYIAGPMSGYEKFNYPAFHEAEVRLATILSIRHWITRSAKMVTVSRKVSHTRTASVKHFKPF